MAAQIAVASFTGREIVREYKCALVACCFTKQEKEGRQVERIEAAMQLVDHAPGLNARACRQTDQMIVRGHSFKIAKREAPTAVLAVPGL